ncbi:MAG: class I SAM-dependent methyltransferase [Caenibius sp.]
MGLQSWYDEHVVPRIIRCACGLDVMTERRKQVVPLAQGRVFEIGCGGGHNQPHYDRERVTSFAGIDPSGKLLDYARAEANAKGWSADIRQGVGEDIPFADEEFDTAVCTFTLCSVQDQSRVLSELRRILKPGGTLLFLEHGKSPDSRVQRWQERIEPVWKHLVGGCHLTRPVSSAIADSGFAVTPIDKGYTPKTPRFAGWMEWGVATKTA